MENTAHRAIAIVGAGAILPDAPNLSDFWNNIKKGRYSISEVDPERWDPELYYDANPATPDRTYSKIGGWVREYEWDPIKWRLPIPPCVTDAMDGAQKWAIGCTRAALADYGYPKKLLDSDRVAVILGNAMAGERHYLTALRLYFPEFEHELMCSPSFANLPQEMRKKIGTELHERIVQHLPTITEDTMPGELANCIAGRVANIFNFRGPNYVVDAACASSVAAMNSAVEGLIDKTFDVAITGGIDRNMGASTFIKFCKIGALSATGTRPYAEGADGFVMGEGAVVFVLKRLSDAEHDGDNIYAVLRGIGASSDGKGKGITAPNPIGQTLSIKSAWRNAGVSPATATYFEGHGTSTRVGDVVEVDSLSSVLRECSLSTHSIALGSVKSNLGHLKAASGAAGLLKTALSLRHKLLPPSVNCERPNSQIDFAHSPLYVNTELKEWQIKNGDVRCAGVSAFGFGGTNFHAVMEEYVPGRLNGGARRSVAVLDTPVRSELVTPVEASSHTVRNEFPSKAPLRGTVVLGAKSEPDLVARLRSVHQSAEAGRVPESSAPMASDLEAAERIAIDFTDAGELASKAGKALKVLSGDQSGAWKLLRSQGICRGRGTPPKVAFLYPGQGSQYINMLKSLRAVEPIVADTFSEADRVLTPILGKPLTEFIFVDENDNAALERAEADLRQTAITQPAVLAADIALTRVMAAYGISPDMTMGHSLGEYGALVATGGLPFEDALMAVSARGREMARVALDDNGKMAAVFAPLPEIERVLRTIDGYAVIANINSDRQAVIGGSSKSIDEAVKVFQELGFTAALLPVSHAFHTSIVAPASDPLQRLLQRLRLHAPRVPVVANVDGEFYPDDENAPSKMAAILGRQVASPVQFVRGLRTLYDAGARIFVEIGPKKALQGFADDVLGNREDVVSTYTNHPKLGDLTALNQALCALYAAGLGNGRTVSSAQDLAVRINASTEESTKEMDMERATEIVSSDAAETMPERAKHREHDDQTRGAIVITGAALGLPGTEHIFDDGNLGRILRGEQFIDEIPVRFRRAMLDKNITRLVKSETGDPTFETINKLSDVLKLAGRGGAFDIGEEFGVSADRIAALDRTTQLAIAAGIDAMRDAGIPVVMRYKTTTKGTQLPDRWGLPDSLRDDTGVIFASAFPGYDSFADEMSRYHTDRALREQIAAMEHLLERAGEENGYSTLLTLEIKRHIAELQLSLEQRKYIFDRRFLFRILAMGHSQFAELIDARGPNTQINSACASTTQALALAEDWIHAGRCRRVIVISADDATSDHMMEWIGAGFLASGAAATDDVVEDAAIPFDRRRHGLIVGMGAAALVVEDASAARERGLQPICEVLGSVTANSAFHGSRLDVRHIGQVMLQLISQVESNFGLDRHLISKDMVFVSHETYTPARGGSASAEIHALREVFRESANDIVIANTKGYTGHPMATGIEDALAVKMLETGCVPPVANFKEVDPELGMLNLSKGGAYPVQYALRLAAGFGSQISMSLLRWVRTKDGTRRAPNALGYEYRIVDQSVWQDWLRDISGSAVAEIEVEKRVLRVRDQAASARMSKAQSAEVKSKQNSPAQQAGEIATPPRKPVQPAEASGDRRISLPTVIPGSSALASVPDDSLEEHVINIVSHITGYPADMLDLNARLESDLGVDSVKQAEAFAAVSDAFGIEPDETLRLSDFQTLADVKEYVQDRLPAKVPIGAAAVTLQEPKTTDSSLVTSSIAAQPGTSVKDSLLALVVEKTGYPKEMLDMDLDLEADLGIDTVKQAELFAAIRQNYDIPRDQNLKLRDFPTLAHVLKFVYEKRPELAGINTGQSQTAVVTDVPREPEIEIKSITEQPAPEPELSVASVPEIMPAEIKEKVLQIVAEKTGYPTDMLDLDLDLEADLGIDTVKQAEMFAAIRGAFGIPRDQNLKLRDFPTLAHVIRFAEERQPRTAQAVPDTAPSIVLPQEEHQEMPSVPGADQIKEKVLQIVAEKTGYPTDMLDLDLDLEADLGIDTVKQAEMFAAIRGTFNIPRDQNLKLRDFPTLAHVIKFAHDRRLQTEPVHEPTAMTPQEELRPIPVPPKPRLGLASFDAANAVPRRVPFPVLRPPLSMCKVTGVRLGTHSRVIVMKDTGGAGEAISTQLRGLDVEVLELRTAMSPKAIEDLVDTWLSRGSVQGVYWLPALDEEGSLITASLSAVHEALRVRVKLLYGLMRKLYDKVASHDTFLITATRLGGQHGYDEVGATAPLGGAVTGFTKAYKREHLEATVKAIDFETTIQPTEIATLLIQETLHDPAAIEIGYKHGVRWTVGMREEPAANGLKGMTLDERSVFVVTGAAGSIVSAITADLAAASGGTFYLLDIAPQPDEQNPDMERFVHDKDALKRDLFARIQTRGQRATPALVEKELSALERAHAAHSAMAAIREAGGTVHYIPVNITDVAAVRNAINIVRERSGGVDVLLHAAGVERSHFLPDKPPEEFDLVFDVKVGGFINLLRAIGDMPLGAIVAFSSVAGRFGNAGQTDYSAANDTLCKIISSLRTTRPETRAIAIDWTAWAGIGMATRGSIPKLMELAGIDMLVPEAGTPVIRRELTTGATRGEVIIAKRLGLMTEELDDSGGLDALGADAVATHGPMIGVIRSTRINDGLIVEVTLNPKEQPFLRDHQIQGTPVLPGVMGMESFAEISSILLPGWNVTGLEEVNFLAPFKFYKNEPRELTLRATLSSRGADVFADCRLIGRRHLPNNPEPQETTHFTARVLLSRKSLKKPVGETFSTTGEALIGAEDIYRLYFHGPAYRVVKQAWRDEQRMIGELTGGLPIDHYPADSPTLISPRLIELCFQTAGLWEIATQGRFGLPQHIDTMRFYGVPIGSKPLYAIITPGEGEGTFHAEVADSSGTRYLELTGYRTVAIPAIGDQKIIKRLQDAFQHEHLQAA